ncbi:histidine phosphatase superfamily [Lasiosphaeria ovina]|uniref:Histidine phosphatase superfamily n=1 Tax=Lasiosphaeria ovina TaxID=92902 RepID=A0AAE0NA14_9PEZI|nr:histidine phosphatase superfamily [Lasiosphaeria ovina]
MAATKQITTLGARSYSYSNGDSQESYRNLAVGLFRPEIQRHHKRTLYAANAFPVEPYRWNCDDAQLYFYGAATDAPVRRPQDTLPKPAVPMYWQTDNATANTFVESAGGWQGRCQFPQLTAGRLADAWQYLYRVYGTLLGFMPPPRLGGKSNESNREAWHRCVCYRVTTNVITSQVAGMVASRMMRGDSDSKSHGYSSDAIDVLAQPAAVDSLEPRYPCPAAARLYSGPIKASSAPWRAHLDAAAPLFAAIDTHLGPRQCHGKPLPCGSTKISGNGSRDVQGDGFCGDQAIPAGRATLAAAASSFGVYIAELAANLRVAMADGNGNEGVLWFHNIAHDGSMSRLLSVLQADERDVWPGMGSEIIFELHRRKGVAEYFIRVLFGGQVLKSPNPSLGVMDMLPAETLLAYFDGLVGKGATLVRHV